MKIPSMIHNYVDKEDVPSHIKLPTTLTNTLNKDFLEYIDKTVLSKMSMMETTNRYESANKSVTKLMPKNIFHRERRIIDCLSTTTILRCNFGEMIFLPILLDLGIPYDSIPKGLSKKWFTNDNTKQQRRFYSSEQEVKQQRKFCHKSRKTDNKQKTKKYGSTRREKGEPLKT